MRKRLKLFYYKLDLQLQKLNAKLPRLLRMSKYGLITTFVSMMFATGVVVAADEVPIGRVCTNLEGYLGNPDCAGFNMEGMVPDLLEIGEVVVMPSTQPVVNADTGQVVGHQVQSEGLIGGVNNLMVDTFEESSRISAVEYVAHTIQDAGLVQPANAAQSGFVMFNPILNLWKIFRNMALSFVVVIGMILALMILFRVQQGQGYVTIINALPKLLISILLILFSYSIAGLLVDMGNVLEGASVSLLWREEFIDSKTWDRNNENGRPIEWPVNLCSEHSDDPSGCDEIEDPSENNYHIFRLISRLVNFHHWTDAGDDVNLVTDILRAPTKIGILDDPIKFLGDSGVGGLGDSIIKLAIGVTILTGIAKVFFVLLRAFAEMVLYTIFSPLVFVAYPLSPSVLTSWIRYFLANSLLFPGTFFMLFLANIIAGDTKTPWGTSGELDVAGNAPDLLVDTVQRSDFLSKMVGLVIVMMIPGLRAFIMQQLKVTENLMIQQAQQSFRNVASRIPFVGGLVNL